jgi:hypothetical protein
MRGKIQLYGKPNSQSCAVIALSFDLNGGVEISLGSE